MHIPWSETEPKYETYSECNVAYLSSLQMSLPCGSFISFLVEERRYIGRIVAPSNHQSQGVKVNIFVPINELLESLSLSNSLSVQDHISQRQNPYLSPQASCCSGISELVQTSSAMLIVSSDIHDILFVFRPDAVENGDIECQGMTRAYLLRYRHMGGGVLQELDISICRPFPSKYDGYRNYHCDCSPHRAWVTIETIRNKVQRVLCRVSEKQGTVFCRGRATIPASEDCWKFICGSLPMGLQMFESIKISGLVRNGMVYQTYRKKRTNECFRFETCDLLALFKGLFSDVSVIGVRKPRPK